MGGVVRTVEMHVARLWWRLGCRARAEAVRLGARRGAGGWGGSGQRGAG